MRFGLFCFLLWLTVTYIYIYIYSSLLASLFDRWKEGRRIAVWAPCVCLVQRLCFRRREILVAVGHG